LDYLDLDFQIRELAGSPGMDDFASPGIYFTVNSRLTVNNSIDSNPFLTVNVLFKHVQKPQKNVREPLNREQLIVTFGKGRVN
jgi:hypothetical protein